MTVTWKAGEFEKRIREAAMRGVVVAIHKVDAKAVDLILNTSKSGRVYRRRGITHQASAPGEPPASDTGTLLNRRRIDLLPEEIAARLTFSAKHAAPLEFGTRNMAPRPFARRALAETREEQVKAIADEITAALK
jgi:HK97 gp10 family phage protein